ncbi:MAG: hypothetical protein J6T10_23085 [Methanobrevibacter sp.]|nr:hypothetical protein [Methanobrevibacter sp.]
MTQILVNTIGSLILIILFVIDIVNNNDETKEKKFVRTVFELAIAIILLFFNLFVGTYYGS